MAISIKAVLTSGTPRQLIFYYDEIDHAAEGTVLAVSSTGYTGYSAAPWCKQSISHVRFDSSCRNWQPTGLSLFFGYAAEHSQNSPETFDLRFLNVSNVTTFVGMFMRCARVTTLDLSTWTLKSGVSTNSMFNGCSALTTLKISAGFNTDNITSSSNMFTDCTSLPNYSASAIDKTNCKSRKDGGYCYVMARQTTVTGTPETVTIVDSSDPSITYGTATAQPLLKLGDYVDTQDAVTGVITRNVGVKVLDGTETWALHSSGAMSTLVMPHVKVSNLTCYCTHFEGWPNSSSIVNMPVGTFKQATSTEETLFKTSFTTTADWRAWLAEQYAAGTPVTVYYPLTTPVTENVAPQLKGTSVNEDDVDLDIVGEISGLTAVEDTSAHTTPTPEEPLDLRCNNGTLKAQHESGLPLGYTKVEYIAPSGSGQYIDTGIIGTASTEIEAKYWYDAVRTSSGHALCGQRSSSNALLLSNYATSSSTVINPTETINGYVAVGSMTDGTGKLALPQAAQTVNTIKITADGYVYLNGAKVYTAPMTRVAPPSINMFLFRANVSGSIPEDYAVNDRIYWFKMRENGTLTFNGIPAKRDSDNVYGMYDLVSNTFLTNVGTGAFTAGSAVSDPIVLTADGTQEVVTVTGKNLLDPTAIKTGYYIDANGVERAATTSPDEYLIRQARVEPSTQYTLSYIGNSTSYTQRWHAYDRNGNWISQITDNIPSSVGQRVTGTFRTPANCYYVRQGGRSQVDYQLELGDMATTYEPYRAFTFNPNDLLRTSSTYFDTHEAVSGLLTHNIGVKVLDGTEDWQATANAGKYFLHPAPAYARTNFSALCTRYPVVGTQTGSSGVPYGNFGVYVSSGTWMEWYVADTQFTTVDELTARMAADYAAGNPWIVVYPLATATTETVTQQRDVLGAKGDSIHVEVTAASMSPLNVSDVETVHTVPAPEQPLQILTNNGAITVDSQGNIGTAGPAEQIYARSKNLWDEVYPDVASTIQYRSIYLGAGQYTMSTDDYPITSAAVVFFFKGQATSGANNSTNGVYKNTPRTVNSTDGWVTVAYRNGSGPGLPGTVPSDFHFQIEAGSTATYYMRHKISLPVSPEMLLKVGSYSDSQEIVGGVVKRNVGVKVLDGTEAWAGDDGTPYYINIPQLAGATSRIGLSNYFPCTNTAAGQAGKFHFGGATVNGNVVFSVSNTWPTKDAFKAWLAARYAAGDPVIIVYPLATETTESVAGQNLHLIRGQNTIYAESPLAAPSFTFAAKYNKHEGFRTVQHPWTENTFVDGVLTIYQSWQPERDGRQLNFD